MTKVPTIPPKMARIGFEPATAPRRRKNHMLLPKPDRTAPPDKALNVADASICKILSAISNDERKALDYIVDSATLAGPGDQVPTAIYLMIPATPWLLDVLAQFGCEVVDREPDECGGLSFDVEPELGPGSHYQALGQPVGKRLPLIRIDKNGIATRPDGSRWRFQPVPAGRRPRS